MDKQTVKRFSNRKGEVTVTMNGISYNVQIIRYGNLRTGIPTSKCEYQDLDSVIAGEYFTAFVAELKKKPITPPKTYCAKCNKMCSESNCPSQMGGANYYKIFQKSCYFRRSR